MSHRALIVEDDPAITSLVVDALASLEHEYDTASSQEEAVKRLKANRYSYVLLDISIPARSLNGIARIQNTENLLEKMSELDSKAPPVIVMSDYAVGDLERTVDVMRLAMAMARRGTVDVIAKPFPTAGRTLDRVIKKVLAGKVEPTRINWPDRPSPESSPQAKDHANWLTVTQAAELLAKDLPSLDLKKARSRVSTAAGRMEFKYAGTRRDRRVEPISFDAWRLKQRDRDLDAEDREDQ